MSFQDINKIQYEIVKMLAGETKNLFIVGDDDQSIYKFRGARPELMLNFPKDFENTRQVILNRNYRCGKRSYRLRKISFLIIQNVLKRRCRQEKMLQVWLRSVHLKITMRRISISFTRSRKRWQRRHRYPRSRSFIGPIRDQDS